MEVKIETGANNCYYFQLEPIRKVNNGVLSKLQSIAGHSSSQIGFNKL